MRLISKFVLLAALLCGTPLVAAQSARNTIYEVEVLVFQNFLEELEGGEFWGPDEPESEERLMELENAMVVGGAPGEASPLSLAAEKMGREGGNYRVLAHKRWIQNADAKSNSQRIRISAGPIENTTLDGTVVFYVSRFLHVDVNLALATDNAGLIYPGADTESVPAREVYRIKEHRRIKTVDINYFDHPKFGVLIQIKPVQVTRN